MVQLELGAVADVRSGDLAHGDKKRLDIAIALATEPEILLLDEPVAGMSRDEARKTEALVRKLASSMTVLIIEHDMDLIMGISDSITVLEAGPRPRQRHAGRDSREPARARSLSRRPQRKRRSTRDGDRDRAAARDRPARELLRREPHPQVGVARRRRRRNRRAAGPQRRRQDDDAQVDRRLGARRAAAA